MGPQGSAGVAPTAMSLTFYLPQIQLIMIHLWMLLSAKGVKVEKIKKIRRT